jgi:hypothetical protein
MPSRRAVGAEKGRKTREPDLVGGNLRVGSSPNQALSLLICLLQAFDVNLVHLEHCFHDLS